MFWGKLMLRELVAASDSLLLLNLAGHVSSGSLVLEALLGAVCSTFMTACSLMPASSAYTTRFFGRLVAISVHGKRFHA